MPPPNLGEPSAQFPLLRLRGGGPKGKDKKGKGDKGKKGKGKGKDDGKAPLGEGEEMSEEQLKETIGLLRSDLEHEREERNYFQLERDKINTFWEITKKELEDRKAELRNKDREMEELEERHQVEIKVYKQKVKHLLYEHQNNVAQLKEAGELALKLQQEEHRQHESQSKRDQRSLKLELKELELAHEDAIRELKQATTVPTHMAPVNAALCSWSPFLGAWRCFRESRH